MVSKFVTDDEIPLASGTNNREIGIISLGVACCLGLLAEVTVVKGPRRVLRRIRLVAPWFVLTLMLSLNWNIAKTFAQSDAPREVSESILPYVKALAWPIVVLIASVLFRDALSLLMSRLTGASGPWGKFDFEPAAKDLLDDALANESNSRAASREPHRESAEKRGPAPEAAAAKVSDDDTTVTPGEKDKGSSALEADKPRRKAPEFHRPYATNDGEQGIHITDSFKDWIVRRNRERSIDDVLSPAWAKTRLVGRFIISWAQLEQAANQVLEEMTENGLIDDVSRQRRGSPVKAAFRELAAFGVVNPESVRIAMEAQRLRNEILHVGAESQSSATIDGLVDTAESLLRTLEDGVGRLREMGEPSP